MKYVRLILIQVIVIGFLLSIRGTTLPEWLDSILIIVSLSLGVTALLEGKTATPAPVELVEDDIEEPVRPPRPLQPDVVCPECFGAGYRMYVLGGIQRQESCQTCKGRREIPQAQAKAYTEAHPNR